MSGVHSWQTALNSCGKKQRNVCTEHRYGSMSCTLSISFGSLYSCYKGEVKKEEMLKPP